MQHFVMPQGGVQKHQRLFRLLHEDSLATVIAARVDAGAGEVEEMPAFLCDAAGKLASGGRPRTRWPKRGLFGFGRRAAKPGGDDEFLGAVRAR